jgi:hypothetical protein
MELYKVGMFVVIVLMVAWVVRVFTNYFDGFSPSILEEEGREEKE